MAFTLEDGSGVTGANAYASVADVLAYLTDRGRQAEADWNALTATKQQGYIIEATDYLEKVYGDRWKGWKYSSTQGLGWPRIDVLGNDGWYYTDLTIPTALIHATAELAVRRAAGTALLPDPTWDTSGRAVVEKQVGPIRKKFAQGSVVKKVRPLPAVEKLLWDITTPRGARAVR